ncbi:NAD(P)/FAD-dependent oxidoreductase [Candidatus Saccharibacteria bacterium]|nr:NAD(P)/FAD-dependent oxidoreductase [Candidatus Saccharibacteria bacterium]
MKKFDYDYVVIGSGAAGKAAALMAGGAGVKTAIIEADRWGGNTLNYRNVPEAASIHFASLYAQAVRGARFGLSSTSLRYNYPTALNWRLTAARRAGAGSTKELEDVGVTTMKGFAHFVSPHEITVGEKGPVSAKKFLIATGSVLDENGITGADSVPHLTPRTAMSIGRLPKVVLVVGGGASGCEIAEYYANLGVQVLLVELAERLLPKEDSEVGEMLEFYFTKQLRINVLTRSRVVAIERDGQHKKVVFLRGGQEKAVKVEEIVIATGSQPALDLGLENAGVKFSAAGIKVNKEMQTSAKHIYAAGDVVGGRSSTEKATYEAVVATANIINKGHSPADYRGFARVTNTFPMVASVGMTEDDCVKHARKYKVALAPLSTTGASNIEDFRTGFIKLVGDRDGRILGGTVVAPRADLIIQEIALAIRQEMKAVDLASVPHIADSWGEIVKIAARRLA